MLGDIYYYGCWTTYPNFADINSDRQLKYPSDCIDAGDDGYLTTDSETDILGQPRISGWQVDVGAYEYQK